jgi:hypothetical protein
MNTLYAGIPLGVKKVPAKTNTSTPQMNTSSNKGILRVPPTFVTETRPLVDWGFGKAGSDGNIQRPVLDRMIQDNPQM